MTSDIWDKPPTDGEEPSRFDRTASVRKLTEAVHIYGPRIAHDSFRVPFGSWLYRLGSACHDRDLDRSANLEKAAINEAEPIDPDVAG